MQEVRHTNYEIIKLTISVNHQAFIENNKFSDLHCLFSNLSHQRTPMYIYIYIHIVMFKFETLFLTSQTKMKI